MNKPIIDLSGAKILTVDDVSANLDVLGQSLETSGYNVLVATSGEMALKVVERVEPDLILLDVMMPGVDGFETCRRLKANPETEDIPVIFLTAQGELEGILQGFRAGGVDYITKPFQKEEVLIRIRMHLERHRLARDLADLNAHLEEKVEERTYQLQQRLMELEGKDRIAQYLLSYHTLEEALGLVLEVVTDVMDFDEATIYLLDDGSFNPAAAIVSDPPGTRVPLEQLKEKESVVSPSEYVEAFEEVRETLAPTSVQVSDSAFAVAPIVSENELLGLIKAERKEGEVGEDALQTLASFALQAAVAIHDAQIQEDSDKWKEQLNQVMELDEIIQDPEQLDELSRNPGE